MVLTKPSPGILSACCCFAPGRLSATVVVVVVVVVVVAVVVTDCVVVAVAKIYLVFIHRSPTNTCSKNNDCILLDVIFVVVIVFCRIRSWNIVLFFVVWILCVQERR